MDMHNWVSRLALTGTFFLPNGIGFNLRGRRKLAAGQRWPPTQQAAQCVVNELQKNLTQTLPSGFAVFSANAVLEVIPWQCLSIVQAGDNGSKVEETP
jgi:hypothetical protein